MSEYFSIAIQNLSSLQSDNGKSLNKNEIRGYAKAKVEASFYEF